MSLYDVEAQSRYSQEMSEATKDNSAQPYRVLARKYRPHSFTDLIGQEPMVQTLSNAFRTGRIAQAYMLTGVRGVGKTTTARILARALNYKNETHDQPVIELDDEGEHCRAIMDGRHMDVIEMDAASHTGIDDIRDLIESAQYRPATARYKVYIIDEVHMLSKNAFNGLLKTLEEPPEHLKFIFATTEIRKVPVTILSRCQRFDLRRIDANALTGHLAGICEKEGVQAETDALSIIARAAEGSARDALSMLDQAIAFGAGEKDSTISAETMRSMLGLSDRARIIDLFSHVMKGNITEALEELKSQYDTGAEPSVVMADLADFVHLVTRLKYVPETSDDAALSEIEKTKGTQFAEELSVRALGRAWQILLNGISEVNGSERPLPAAEMLLVRLTHASALPTPDELIKSRNEGNSPTHLSGNGQASDGNQTNSLPVGENTPPPTSGETTQGSNTPVMSTSSSGKVIAMANPIPVNNKDDEDAASKPVRHLNKFEDLIFLIEDKRDLVMKTAISRHVRLVSFADGRMEMNLVESPPRDFLPNLGKKLEEWTGKRWMLSLSKEEGSPTLQEQEKAEADTRMETALSDPAVEKILEQFPGARIVDIRIPEEAALVSPADSRDEFDDTNE